MSQDISEKIIVFGVGGHAQVVMDTITQQGFHTVECFLDKLDTSAARTFHGIPVFNETYLAELVSRGICGGLVAIGDNKRRRTVFGQAIAAGVVPVSVCHPRAYIATSARVGRGTAIFAMAIVNPAASVGDNVIINSGALIEHDCQVGDHVHIAPRAVLCGGVTVDEGALVGAGAVVVPGIRIGAWSIVGAGAVVAKDVPAGACVVGVPSRRLEERNRD